MNSTEKNLLITALLGIFLVFIWTLSNYREVNKKQTEVQNQKESQTITQAEKNKKKVESLPQITSTELKSLILEKNSPTIVDIRNEKLYKKNHITNSMHVSTLDLNRPSGNIVLVAEYGNEMELLSFYDLLTEKNNHVKILIGGFNTWKSYSGLTVSFGNSNSFVDQAKVKLIEPRDVNDFYTKNPEKTLIIDIRREGNFKKSHIPGAINIPVSKLEERHRDISMRKKIYVYGAEDFSSFNAGVMLYDLGFFNTETINGGFAAWEKYDYPVENDESESKKEE